MRHGDAYQTQVAVVAREVDCRQQRHIQRARGGAAHLPRQQLQQRQRALDPQRDAALPAVHPEWQRVEQWRQRVGQRRGPVVERHGTEVVPPRACTKRFANAATQHQAQHEKVLRHHGRELVERLHRRRERKQSRGLGQLGEHLQAREGPVVTRHAREQPGHGRSGCSLEHTGEEAQRGPREHGSVAVDPPRPRCAQQPVVASGLRVQRPHGGRIRQGQQLGEEHRSDAERGSAPAGGPQRQRSRASSAHCQKVPVAHERFHRGWPCVSRLSFSALSGARAATDEDRPSHPDDGL